VRLAVGADGRAGFHRYHSDQLVTDLHCGQLAPELLDGLGSSDWAPGGQLLVVVDDDAQRHAVQTTRQGRRTNTEVVEGKHQAVQRVNGRSWRIPLTAFWQAHRDAARVYSSVVAEWAQASAGMTAWDLYGGAGLFAAVLGTAVGESGQVLTVDTSRAASRAARQALADLPQVRVLTDSVRRALTGQQQAADVAVLDPPRAGAGREIIDLLASAGVPRVVHIGCEAASFARDIGLYLSHGYVVDELRVFDAFPLTHHVECVALLTRARQATTK
jgi:tRNA/tmRNA/rRNA uracil-C5-methylase (TrmA/RlmC/RlmD family)